MLRRFFVVFYALLHIPILLFTLAFDDSYIYTMMDNQVYQARCDSNNKLIVLQGTVDGSPYTFTDLELDAPSSRTDIYETLRFYCGYYEEVEEYINLYITANESGGRGTSAVNMAYFDFKTSAPKIYETNYKIEVAGDASDYTPLFNALLMSIFGAVIYYLFLQVARIIYQYIVFGKFNWHPYRKINT